MDFNILLVSLLPKDDELFKVSGNVKNIQLFEEALGYSKINFEEYSIKVIVHDPQKGIMAGIISRKSKVSFHDKDFNPHEEEDYPPVIWFWDREEQCILIEKKTKVFSNPELSSKAFTDISNNLILAEHGLRAHIKPKTIKHDFWDALEKFEYVHHVQFKLTAPNLFGDTKKEMGSFLHEVVDQTNASEFSPTFSNSDGKLLLKPSSWLSTMIDWVAEGAGSWIIKGKNKPQERIRTIESVQKARILAVEGEITELELENYSPQDVADILNVLREKYTYKR